jgi:hypothetical protein
MLEAASSRSHFRYIPQPPVPVPPHWPDRLGDLADQLISELSGPAVAGEPRRHRRFHGPAGGLSIHLHAVMQRRAGAGEECINRAVPAESL